MLETNLLFVPVHNNIALSSLLFFFFVRLSILDNSVLWCISLGSLCWITFIIWQLLQLMLCGMLEIDVDDWERNTIYRHYQHNSKQVGWFWKVSSTATCSSCRSDYLQYCNMSVLPSFSMTIDKTAVAVLCKIYTADAVSPFFLGC